MSLRAMIQSAILHLSLLVAAALTLLPLLWMLAVSLLPAAESGAWLPRHPTLDHYRTLFARLDVARYALNSLAIAAGVTVLSVLINALAGYAFAKLRFRGRDPLFGLLLSAMLIPGQVGMLPLFLILKGLGWVNSYAGVVIPGLVSIFGIFLMRQYALAIPDSILDAARIDGAGEFRIFFSVVLPLCRPILVTLALFTFMGSWNDFMWPLIILTGSEHYTLPVALANLLGEHGQDVELMMAGSLLTVLPVVVLFLLLQRYYVAGLVLGSVKE